MQTVLIADDEKNIRDGLAHFVAAEGYEVIVAADGAEALEKARTLAVDCALIDLRMPKIDGEQLLATLISERPLLPVIIITGHGTVRNAVAAMQSGAYDFITKPVSLDRLGALLKRALGNRRTALDNESLRSELHARDSERAISSASPAMQRVLRVARQVAHTDATILITGESGVGKEVLADFIHAQSPRHSAPIIKVHCASLSESLLESELFGHEQGAFTGATAQRKGRFELADHGTILLDEIGEINQALQVKILRVLQQREFERVGGERTIAVDVRIVAATNRDLQQEIAAGRFREDLYYRLNVLHIDLPPLRNRREDMPRLIAQFLHEFSAANATLNATANDRTRTKHFSASARRVLIDYNWPGNIRELRNCVESAVILSDGDTIEVDHLPEALMRAASATALAERLAAATTADSGSDATATTDAAPAITADSPVIIGGGSSSADTIAADNAAVPIRVPATASIAEAERLLIARALANTNGNKSKAAEQLGIQRVTLYEKIKKYGLADTVASAG